MAPAAVLVRAGALLAAVLLVVTLAARHVSPVPDLVLVLVVAWALLRGPVAGAAVGLGRRLAARPRPARLEPTSACWP